MIYASLPPSRATDLPHLKPKFQTTILSARQFHSLSGPSYTVPDPPSPDDEYAPLGDTPAERRRAMQLILDEVHGMQKTWWDRGEEGWATPAMINSSKVVVLSVSDSKRSPGISQADFLLACPGYTNGCP